MALVLLTIGLRDRRRAADDRLRDQARKIWLWTEWDGPQAGRYTKHMTLLICTIDNQSEEPILDCRFELASMPTAEVAGYHPDPWLVQPHSQWQHNLLADYPKLKGTVYEETDPGPTLQLIFTDAAGVQWRRDSLGHLSLWRRPGPVGTPPRVGCAVRWYGPHR